MIEYTGRTLSVTKIARKMKENKLKWFGHIKRRNSNNIVKNIGEKNFEENREWGRPQKKWMGIIRKDTRSYRVNENIIQIGIEGNI